jgi:hypothetical protein
MVITTDVRLGVHEEEKQAIAEHWTHHNGILPPAMVGVLVFLKWVCAIDFASWVTPEVCESKWQEHQARACWWLVSQGVSDDSAARWVRVWMYRERSPEEDAANLKAIGDEVERHFSDDGPAACVSHVLMPMGRH